MGFFFLYSTVFCEEKMFSPLSLRFFGLCSLFLHSGHDSLLSFCFIFLRMDGGAKAWIQNVGSGHWHKPNRDFDLFPPRHLNKSPLPHIYRLFAILGGQGGGAVQGRPDERSWGFTELFPRFLGILAKKCQNNCNIPSLSKSFLFYEKKNCDQLQKLL